MYHWGDSLKGMFTKFVYIFQHVDKWHHIFAISSYIKLATFFQIWNRGSRTGIFTPMKKLKSFFFCFSLKMKSRSCLYYLSCNIKLGKYNIDTKSASPSKHSSTLKFWKSKTQREMHFSFNRYLLLLRPPEWILDKVKVISCSKRRFLDVWKPFTTTF